MVVGEYSSRDVGAETWIERAILERKCGCAPEPIDERTTSPVALYSTTYTIPCTIYRIYRVYTMSYPFRIIHALTYFHSYEASSRKYSTDYRGQILRNFTRLNALGRGSICPFVRAIYRSLKVRKPVLSNDKV